MNALSLKQMCLYSTSAADRVRIVHAVQYTLSYLFTASYTPWNAFP
jgi:hypothetical protein